MLSFEHGPGSLGHSNFFDIGLVVKITKNQHYFWYTIPINSELISMSFRRLLAIGCVAQRVINVYSVIFRLKK